MTIRTDPPSLRWSQPACRGARSRLLQTGAGAAEAAAAQCSVIGDAAAGVAGEQHTKGDHAQCQDEVQPVVGVVDGDKVGGAAIPTRDDQIRKIFWRAALIDRAPSVLTPPLTVLTLGAIAVTALVVAARFSTVAAALGSSVSAPPQHLI
jgi:hypothetical protein